MGKYFVYFSITGNGDFIAQELEKKGYQPVKIELIKPIKKVGFGMILNYGGRAMFGKREKIKEISLELQNDDLVIVGSPIWNDRLSTPVLTVLDKFAFNKESTRFILYPAGKETKKSFKQIKKMGFVLEPIVSPYPLKNQEQTIELIKNL